MTAIWKNGGADALNARTTFPVLQGSIEVDDVIIGAGITGLTTALKLIDAGRRVAVVEAHSVAGSSTGNSTGNLYAPPSIGLAEIEKKWSTDEVCALVEMRQQGVNDIADIIARFSIDCDFQPVPLHWCAAAGDQTAIDQVEAEHRISTRAGLDAHLHQRLPELPMSLGRVLTIENQAQFNPYRFCAGLATALQELGTQIFEHSQVMDIDADNHRIKTTQGEVRAANIIQATHTPKGIHLLHAEMQVFREYGCASTFNQASVDQESVDQESVPNGIYWMLSDSQSIRSHVTNGETYLIAVGGKHKTGKGEPEAHYFKQVQDYLSTHFGTKQTAYRWSAQQYKSADLLPYIGRGGHDHVFVATGFAADGLVWGVVAAQIISQQILAQTHPGVPLFDPRRFTPAKSLKNWVKESSTVAQELFKGYLTPAARAQLDEIKPGQARLLKVDGQELAVYHSPEKGLLAVSSICPHMKCRVAWNAEAVSWDCPCHGSRFTVEGDIIEGPACDPLQIHVLDQT